MCKTCGCSFRSRDFGNIERFIEPCILLLLSKRASHGYGLMEDLEKHCGEKVDIGNLYRTLRRMEMDGWVTSSWDKNEAGPDRRTYTITEDGQEFLKNAVTSLIRSNKLIHGFLKGYKRNSQNNNLNKQPWANSPRFSRLGSKSLFTASLHPSVKNARYSRSLNKTKKGGEKR